uniref:NADH-ubiquinone oxidoreductase chain 2 n=1 Tax=Choroterpides apiculata (nomen nudum) TaxID=2729127 RepID=A0A6M3RH22_9DIPT|nr:NADH dehydrogenase subunit 2 [Choroterpides apiculata (nomen nudum)]
MFINTSNLLFFNMLILGTLITISSSTWLGCWIGLEINLLSFIPLMNKNSQFSSESSLKYFLIQALASAIFLVSVLMVSFLNNSLYMNSSLSQILFLIMSSTLLLKMGAAPFHFWFPGVLEGLSWLNSLILMTWQKIAPFLILSYIMNNYLLINLSILLSVIIGSVGGLNQTSLRKIMAYSSINHLGWMLATLLINNNYWILYFIIYSFLSLTMILLFNSWNINHILQVYNLSENKFIMLMLFCNLLSMGGLPPFLGFLPKWLVIQILVINNFLVLSILMVIFTLLALFFYIRIAYPAFLMNCSEIKFINLLNYKFPPFILILTSLNIFGLSLSPFMNTFL